MSSLNELIGNISNSRFSIISEWSLRIILSLLMFSHGQGKVLFLSENPSMPLEIVTGMAFFESFPIFFSWVAAISEAIIIPACILLGGLSFLGASAKTLSTLGGFLATITMVIIIYFLHIDLWEQQWQEFKYQLSLLAISLYFLFK